MLLLTDVDGVYRHLRTPHQMRVDRLDATDAWRLLADGQVARGSMAPKVEAAAGFTDVGGTTMIGSLDQVEGLLAGRAGTVYEPLAQPHATPESDEHPGKSATVSGATPMAHQATSSRMGT